MRADEQILYYLTCKVKDVKISFEKERNICQLFNGGYFVYEHGIRIEKGCFKAWTRQYNSIYYSHVWCFPKDIKSAKQDCVNKLRKSYSEIKKLHVEYELYMKNFKKALNIK